MPKNFKSKGLPVNIKLRKKLANIVSKSKFLGFLHAVYLLVFKPKRVAFVKNPAFQGWGMVTTAKTPWEGGGGYSISKNFSRADALLKKGLFLDIKIKLITNFLICIY